MEKVGIDKLAFYAPSYYLDVETIAKEYEINPEKFSSGLGQSKISIAPPNEDIITMAANAATQILTEEDKASINTIIFATESSFDTSKAAATFLHSLLRLNKNCRPIELKQACYAATCGLQMACALLQQNPNQKILLIASDIACYELGSTAESSQGAGAVAMLLTTSPRIIAIGPESGYFMTESWDFWRPNYSKAAIVDGHLSANLYLKFLEQSWQSYRQISNRNLIDHHHICYHAPVPKLVEKAHRKLSKLNEKPISIEQAANETAESLAYCREVGNCYTASLFLSLLSLLNNHNDNLAGERIGMYSYGSGSSAEFFNGIIQQKYQSQLDKASMEKMLNNRKQLTYNQYREFHEFKLPEDGSTFNLPNYDIGPYRLEKIKNHQRHYSKKSCCSGDKRI
ncbi:MAG: hydroxymethylglutaryl-CoA synthase [Gammaproteobacteria bacterium]|nr:hydroxymethylglutaryl-CoA synthase [Gammaproteobacteria bacterium]